MRVAIAFVATLNCRTTELPSAVITELIDNTFPTVSQTSSGSHESEFQKLNLFSSKDNESSSLNISESSGNKVTSRANSWSMALTCASLKLFNRFANLCRFSFIIASAHDASLHLLDSTRKSYAAWCWASNAATDIAPPVVSTATSTTAATPVPPVARAMTAPPAINPTWPAISIPRCKLAADSELGNSQISSVGFHFTALHSGQFARLAARKSRHCCSFNCRQCFPEYVPPVTMQSIACSPPRRVMPDASDKSSNTKSIAWPFI